MSTFSTICAFTPDRVNVFRFDGTPNAWTKIGFRLGQLYGGDFGLVGTDASGTGEPLGTLLWWRRGMHDFVSHAWHPIGGPGASFAVTPDTVYGLTPDRGAVFRYNGPGQGDWTQVGTGASQIYAGPFGLLATDPNTGDLFRYLGTPMQWEQIGGPGAAFAVAGNSLFGLTPDRRAVYRYDGTGMSWTQVGGPASQLYAGDFGLVATSPVNGNVFRFLGTPMNWAQIGGPGASFAVTQNTVFGLTPDHGAVYRYDGTGTSWTQVGGPAAAIFAFNEEVAPDP